MWIGLKIRGLAEKSVQEAVKSRYPVILHMDGSQPLVSSRRKVDVYSL